MSKKSSDQEAASLTLATSIRRAVSHLNRRLRPVMKLEGLPLAKLSVLGHLSRRDGLTPTELAVLDGVKVQSLTRLIAELESEGLVRRSPDLEDARQTHLSLSGQGKQLLMRGGMAADARMASLIANEFTVQEIALLQKACVLLSRLADLV